MSLELKEARENAGYSIEYVASKLNIRKQYLIDLESGNYNALPGKIYVDGYKRMYCELLGISNDDIKIEEAFVPKIPDKIKFELKYKKYIVLFCIFMLIVTGAVYRKYREPISSNSIIEHEISD